MISLLVPSRGRPDYVDRLWETVNDTVWGEWELIVRLDDDDPMLDDYPKGYGQTYVIGPRIVLSKCWNECYDVAKGDIFWHGGDDVTFRTLGWDRIVKDALPPDNIAFVHGHDLSPNGHWLGTHGFLHRDWVDAVGYFVPPYFSSDYNDMWLVDVSDMIDRHIYVPIVTEHHHPDFGKSQKDQTYHDRIARHVADDVDSLYRSPEMVANRIADAEKLKKVMR